MPRVSFIRLLLVFVLTLGAQRLLASTITYAVGSCKPNLPTYTSISAALVATPAPNIVMVCPGTYNEQVQITQSVTLEGVSNGDSAQAIIAPPSGGLVVNATSDTGQAVGAQLWVDNASGPVTVTDMTLDAAGSLIPAASIVGVFYQNSSGTVNRVTTRNQIGNGLGVGVWLEGGAANPSVTVENSSIHDFAKTGIFAETNSVASELAAAIRGNVVNGVGQVGLIGISVSAGATSIVTTNLVVGIALHSVAIATNVGAAGSISGNTVINSSQALGVVAGADGVSVTGNKIVSDNAGIFVTTPLAAIQGNTILGGQVGIDFACQSNGNVHSNTITDVVVGLSDVPAGVATNNSYFNVGTIRTGSC
jgi:hypothetical protein